MHANHSATGRLGSGATALAAVEVYQKRMLEALNQLLSEAAKVIDHRRREWRRAMKAIGDVLSEEASKPKECLATSFRLARAETGGAKQAIDERLDKTAAVLRLELESFDEGWTSPVPERWTNRHPALYAVLLLICGSLLGGVVAHFWPAPSTPANEVTKL